jgi:hypothetical protein
MKVGQSSLQSAQFFVNAAYLLMKILKYMLVALVIERVKLGFYRRPNQSRAYTGLYPNGFYQITLLLMMCQQQLVLEEKYLKAGILI